MKIKKAIILMLMTTILLFIPNIVKANSDIVVMLDPGHGGSDSGATGGELIEKNLNWKIATKVKEIFDNTEGITGILTRGENDNPSLYDRGIAARDNNAELLVSFHINSSEYSGASGAEVYITGNTNQKRYYEYSKVLGESILSNLNSIGVKSNVYKPITKFSTDGELYADGFLSDWYGIIRAPMYYGIPGMIIEHAYINNAYDRANYLNDAMLMKMAEADAKAIIQNKELFRRDFVGNVNTELITIDPIQSSTGEDYIGGYIYIAEWVGNDCRTPNTLPDITLKSTDGKVSEKMYVSYQEGIKYYYDKNLKDIDINKEYYIEVKLTDTRNVAPEAQKRQIVSLPNKVLKQDYKNRILKTINNKIVFSEGEYTGDIRTTVQEVKLVQNGNGENYIGVYANIEEIVNGVTRTPRAMPEVYLKSTDGSVSLKMYIGYEDGSTYYFDKMIEYLDTSKEYYLEAFLTSEDNISSNKNQKIAIGNQKIGEFNGINVLAQDNNMVLTFEGTINTELSKMEIIQNGNGENYISGNIYIAEWVENDCRKPSTLPNMTLKSTDGTYEKKMYISYENGIEYYYDVNIETLDDTKEYYIEVKLTNPNNIASESDKKQIAKISPQGQIGITTSKYKVTTSGNIIKVQDIGKYYGIINTELYKMGVIQNEKGENYISGNIYIAEWVENDCRTPSSKPQIKLKSTDGTYEQGAYVSYEGGIEYYFDSNIENIDISKTYYLEVKLTNPKNMATEISQTQTAKIKPQGTIGTWTNGNQVIVSGNNINITEYKYYGTINTELYKMGVIQNEKGENYISGSIYIAEWIENVCRTPSSKPQIKLKSTDGTYEKSAYVSYEGGIEYYFDSNIENIDTNKTFYLEVKLTNPKNMAPEVSQIQIAKITPQGQIGICINGNIVSVNGNNISIQTVFMEDVRKETTAKITEEIGISNEKCQEKIENEN